MKKTLSTMAAAAVLMASTAIAPASAQTEPAAPASPAAPMTPAPATPAAPAAPADAAKPADSAATTSTETETDTAAASGGYITEQAENQISANDYIGKSVYTSDDKSIGNVTDLIMEEDGGIVAAVIGVGGFLGIGQKDVAVPMDKITMTRDAENNNEVRLTTTETAESLQAAPEFKTLDDKQAEADRTTTSSTMPAAGTGAGTGAGAGGAATTPAAPAPSK
ncbi:PRC-barrel domain-containing protein [Rhizobium sp. NTR19]|jgi:sporulation protein YlmC with PRC-barrel domain|uniref:PRC-barrel domain-containing protein n=1 Tax=Neorhizobium turbinariae TaxID=2937795 RepID=A0ABT0ISC7_9HYPH|nr:PRC-barrel domain-containing protein [Neorhizobium turbinariae]MCK8780714.1 PRC-barrel domain-containing protein [Neorhizobium turbinariae]